ncbi:Holliday junction ATP-dependent DNA helicase RuvB [Alphaproteobacteria bacterium]|nr:Holliday junction ATP-dependent DNA helicase RuvB [Alphaproteobacteria bacterium]GHS98193.1 Holliday junction ATP-dependent DNA helicase RuvB [Alphaproteobacteria bacterium]
MPLNAVPKTLLGDQCLSDVESAFEFSLRPQFLKDFIGQKAVKDNLSVFIQAARQRKEALDHTLLFGPPGLGKTTLAQILANEMGRDFRATSGPILAKAGDLAAILTNLSPQSIFFIDEIHRLNPSVEETLYSAMEDFKIDIMIGEGPAARALRLDLPPFTLVGATTRSGMLAQPLRERFGIPFRLQFYETEDLVLIVQRAASLLNVPIDADGALEIARRSRGTPRIAGRLLRRVRDFAYILGEKDALRITYAIAKHALEQLEVDRAGLDAQDMRYLRLLAEYYKGGPAGLDTLAAAMAEDRDTLEDMIEPYLLQQGFIQRTARGRTLTRLAYNHLEGKMEDKQPKASEPLLTSQEK